MSAMTLLRRHASLVRSIIIPLEFSLPSATFAAMITQHCQILMKQILSLPCTATPVKTIFSTKNSLKSTAPLGIKSQVIVSKSRAVGMAIARMDLVYDLNVSME